MSKTCGCKRHCYCQNVLKRNKLFTKRKKRKTTKKKNNASSVSIYLNFCERFLQKKGCATERIFRRLGPFNCQEQFTNSICGKYVAEMFNFMFVSKIKFPFQNVVFTRSIAS
jgi:hypothetical protein